MIPVEGLRSKERDMYKEAAKTLDAAESNNFVSIKTKSDAFLTAFLFITLRIIIINHSKEEL